MTYRKLKQDFKDDTVKIPAGTTVFVTSDELHTACNARWNGIEDVVDQYVIVFQHNGNFHQIGTVETSHFGLRWSRSKKTDWF